MRSRARWSHPAASCWSRCSSASAASAARPDGSLDRAALRELRCSPMRTARRGWKRCCIRPSRPAHAQLARPACRGPYQIVVVPLLAESGAAAGYDRVLLVDCDESPCSAPGWPQRDGSNAAQVDRGGACCAAQALAAGRWRRAAGRRCHRLNRRRCGRAPFCGARVLDVPSCGKGCAQNAFIRRCSAPRTWLHFEQQRTSATRAASGGEAQAQ
jgi:hypothetical protein